MIPQNKQMLYQTAPLDTFGTQTFFCTTTIFQQPEIYTEIYNNNKLTSLEVQFWGLSLILVEYPKLFSSKSHISHNSCNNYHMTDLPNISRRPYLTHLSEKVIPLHWCLLTAPLTERRVGAITTQHNHKNYGTEYIYHRNSQNRYRNVCNNIELILTAPITEWRVRAWPHSTTTPSQKLDRGYRIHNRNQESSE